MTEQLSIEDHEAAVAKAEKNLADAKAAAAYKDFPKWVEVHPSHVVTRGDHRSTPHFADFHISREDGKLLVLVKDAVDEASAKAEAVKA